MSEIFEKQGHPKDAEAKLRSEAYLEEYKKNKKQVVGVVAVISCYRFGYIRSFGNSCLCGILFLYVLDSWSKDFYISRDAGYCDGTCFKRLIIP